MKKTWIALLLALCMLTTIGAASACCTSACCTKPSGTDEAQTMEETCACMMDGKGVDGCECMDGMCGDKCACGEGCKCAEKRLDMLAAEMYALFDKNMELWNKLFGMMSKQPDMSMTYADYLMEQLEAAREMFTQDEYKLMHQDIKMKDTLNLRAHFDRFCDKYSNKTKFSQVYIKFLFSNLLKDFYEKIPNADENLLNEEIDVLYRATIFDTVNEIVLNNVKRLEDAFGANPQMVHREIEIVKQYIYEHYNEDITVDSLAEKVYMAPSYLSSVFKKETGQNLSKFIKSYRMEQAKELLENTMLKIVDIANKCGYQNVSYFCSSFRDCYGVSPQKFRENGEETE